MNSKLKSASAQIDRHLTELVLSSDCYLGLLFDRIWCQTQFKQNKYWDGNAVKYWPTSDRTRFMALHTYWSLSKPGGSMQNNPSLTSTSFNFSLQQMQFNKTAKCKTALAQMRNRKKNSRSKTSEISEPVPPFYLPLSPQLVSPSSGFRVHQAAKPATSLLFEVKGVTSATLSWSEVSNSSI